MGLLAPFATFSTRTFVWFGWGGGKGYSIMDNVLWMLVVRVNMYVLNKLFGLSGLLLD